jgi:outer membrane protein, heavy metal efflux system
MMTNNNARLCLRFGRIEGTVRALLLVPMVMLSALPVSVGRAQDDRTRQGRSASVAQPRASEHSHQPGLDAPASGGPPGCLTLDQAVDRLERENLALAAMRLEVLQTHSDILAAGQRPNSLLLIGGGKDGPVWLRSFDLPLKAWARALAARLAARTTEAQYRNAVRTRTAGLYEAYVGVQEAIQQARYARTSVKGVEQLMKTTESLAEKCQIGKIALDRVAVLQSRTAVAASDAEVGLRKAKLALADLLKLPEAAAERLEVSELNGNAELPLPDIRELTRLAFGHRPDLDAYRLGFWRSEAEWLRAWIEQWPDVYTLFEPNRLGRADAGAKPNAAPRVAGLLVSFPDSDHYRGRVARAQINVAKWQIELTRVERQIVLEVQQAHLEYTHSLTARRQLRDEVLPSGRNVRDDTFRLFMSGEVDMQAYTSAQSEYNEVVCDYVKAAIRHRRAALAVNTAVGKRILPEPP